MTTAETYRQFIERCRARIEELGITYESIDAICGLADGYTAKLMCGIKQMSADTLFAMLGTLGMDMVLQPNPVKVDRLKERQHWKPRVRADQFRPRKEGGAVHMRRPRSDFRDMGLKGGSVVFERFGRDHFVQLQKASAAMRSGRCSLRMSAMASKRWAKERALKKQDHNT